MLEQSTYRKVCDRKVLEDADWLDDDEMLRQWEEGSKEKEKTAVRRIRAQDFTS